MSFQALITSNRSFFVSSFINKLARSIDRLLEIRVSNRLWHDQIDVTAEERFESICEIEEEATPGAKRLASKIDYEIQVTRFRAKGAGSGRAKNLQAFDVKPPAKIGDLLDFFVDRWKRRGGMLRNALSRLFTRTLQKKEEGHHAEAAEERCGLKTDTAVSQPLIHRQERHSRNRPVPFPSPRASVQSVARS
jgi:hypothetical protein